MEEANKHLDSTNESGEKFLPSDDFQAADSGLDWDTLANRGNVSLRHSETRWDRDSLYVKFDPLVVPAGEISCETTPTEESKCDDGTDVNTTLSPNNLNLTNVESEVSFTTTCDKMDISADCSFKSCNNESLNQTMNSTIDDFKLFNDSDLNATLSEASTLEVELLDDLQNQPSLLDASPYTQGKRVVRFSLADYDVTPERLMNGPMSPNESSNANRMSSSPPTADHSIMCLEDELATSKDKTFSVNSLNTPARTALSVNVGLLPQEELNDSNEGTTTLNLSHLSLSNSSLDNQASGTSFLNKTSSSLTSFSSNGDSEELDEFQIQHREQICRIAKRKENIAKQDREYEEAKKASKMKHSENRKKLEELSKQLKAKRQLYERVLRNKESVIGERDHARMVLQDAERKFSNLFNLYENSKRVLSNFEKNYETLTERNNALMKRLERQDERHAEAEKKLHSVQEMIAVDQDQEMAERRNENSKLKNKLRMANLKVQQMESGNQQLDLDNDKLRKLCDDLVEA